MLDNSCSEPDSTFCQALCAHARRMTAVKKTPRWILGVSLLLAVMYATIIWIQTSLYVDVMGGSVTSRNRPFMTTSGVISEGESQKRRTSHPDISNAALLRPQDTSLLRAQDSEVVPNVVHYVWFGEQSPFQFHHFLSVKSVHKFIRPEHILFHCDYEPVGQWWKLVKTSIKSLQIRKRLPPSEIFGNEIVLPEHKSDVARMEILMVHGGIYIDTDVIVLRSFDSLRRYEFTMGLEYHGKPGRLNNGVIVATKDARFLRLWFETYHNFTKREWDYHDCVIPYLLQYEHPDLIHVEEGTINYPTGKQLDMIYKQKYDWSRNYAVHLWHRLHEFDHGPKDIATMDTTFGQIARLVYYGHAKLLT